MLKNIIGCVFYSNAFPYFSHIVKNLPQNMVHIILWDKKTNVTVELFRKKGYSLYHIDDVDLNDYDFFLIDECELHYTNRFDKLSVAGKRFCCLRHSIDQGIRHIPKAHYSIRGHKRNAYPGDATKNTATRENPDVLQRMTTLHPLQKIEYAYTGPYNMGKWTKEIHTPKYKFRTELENVIEQSIPQDKPVIAFFLDEYGYDRSLIQGLKKLAKHATIIYKGLDQNDSRLLALGKKVIKWPSIGYAPNLLRFSADFILCGYYSGTFASSLMIGLPVLPYYTQQIYYKGRGCKELDSFMRFMPKPNSPCRGINQSCIGEFGAVYDIEDTERIVGAMNDTNFWKDYQARLPEIQKKVFGDYCLEDSDVKAAKLILRAFLTGTFGEDVNAIKLIDDE